MNIACFVSSFGHPYKVNLADDSAKSSPETKAGIPASSAQGLLERCMNSTSQVCSSLKNKVISFASSIKASVIAFCSRHFAQGAADSKTPDATVCSAPISSAGSVFTPAPILMLNAMGEIIIDAAQKPETNSGLFRLSPSSTEYAEFKKALAAGGEIDLSRTPRDVITRHLKSELEALAPNKSTFNQLAALKETMDKLDSPEDKSACAQEAIQLFKADQQDTNRASMLLKIFSDCYKVAPESGGQ
ncbi:MAG: hypothetical protein K2Q15_00040, partial [Burkholderiales bacterium]|nr:hypothetical protein [Burkholderiales bacterium]